jgi:hypothetical protein
MSISMPRHAPKRTRAAGKSLPGFPANESRGSRSNVMRLGRPDFASVIARARPRGFRREIGTHMSIEQHRGSGIDEIEGLHHMLPFAIGIGRNAADVFEIDWALTSWAQGAPLADGQVFHAQRSDHWRLTKAVNGLGSEGAGNWKNCKAGSRSKY